MEKSILNAAHSLIMTRKSKETEELCKTKGVYYVRKTIT